jgi:hypothetical protein
MLPYKSGFYYFDVNNLGYYNNLNFDLLLKNDSLIKFNKLFLDGIYISKNMNKDCFFGRYSSQNEEEVLVFICGFLKGLSINQKYKNYLYLKSIEEKEKCFYDFFSKCSIMEK